MVQYTLEVKGFRGLKSPHRYEIGKINALVAPTGSGKSSVLDALRFALTGAEPAGQMISQGEDLCVVRVTFPSGNYYTRAKYSDKRGSKYSVNGKPSTLAKMNMAIQNELGGIPTGNARTIASGEMLSSIGSRQFGELILSYMPETMTAADIFPVLKKKNAYIVSVVRELLPDGEFGTEALDSLHKTCTERKKILKKKISELNGALSTGGLQQQDGLPDRDTVINEIKELRSDRDRQIIQRQKKEEYDRAVAQHERFLSVVNRLENEIREISAVAHTPEERRSAALLMEAHNATVMTSRAALNGIEANEKILQKAIETINQPVCPLSDRLVCTTDKTKVIKEMTDSLQELKEQKSFHQQQLDTARDKIKEAEEALRKIDRDNAEASKKGILIRQLEETRKAEPVIPEMPAPAGNIQEIDAQIEKKNAVLAAIESGARLKRYRELRDEYELKLADYEYLAQAFGPKGEVKQTIMEMYLREFEDPCNRKAAGIFNGMGIRFEAENGITIYCDPTGLGQYIPFESLSAGEKAAVTFILVLTLADISGFRTVIIDELSVLDRDTFAKLIETVKKAEDEYDSVIFACVEHDDIRKLLEEENIPIIRPQ